MNTNPQEIEKKDTVTNRRFVFSLKRRLPILICSLLLVSTTALGLLAYLAVRNASMAIGKERLSGLTTQLGKLFGQSAISINAATHAAANQHPITNFLKNGGATDSVEIIFNKLKLDSTWPQTELYNTTGELKHRWVLSKPLVHISLDTIFRKLSAVKDTSFVGKMYQNGDTVIYPIIATVTENQNHLGFLVRWRFQITTQQSIQQFSELLGSNAQLYFGNIDGSLWTNLLTVASPPPVPVKPGNDFFDYTVKGDPKIASTSMVAGTEWIVLIEFSKSIILKGANEFLRWLVIISLIIIAIGFVTAWLMSRRITTPLEKLTAAASSIASGEYGITVDINRNDELGELAHAFNQMSGELIMAKQGLEEQVKNRTLQLEAVNKELEAFSYSVSHDLRAPLRSINGYAAILHEDYASKLDDEAIRLTGKIMSNGKKMGQLIDDLIAFAQIAKKEIRRNIVDMKALASSCSEELLSQQSSNDKLQITTDSLPVCRGDESLLRQVWLNLISNAIKYSSKNPAPSIEIGCITENGRNTYFVKDNGAGFDMKYADKLFGVFQRLHSNKDFEGSGIGLALTKRIIARHKGNIYAEGKVGEGACFYFNLSI
ncbi:MAG: ATP-binding protein [Chitinophagaceae bacterium]